MRELINQIMGWKPKKIIGLDIDEASVVATGLIKQQNQICLDRYVLLSNLKEFIKDPNFKGLDVMISLPPQVVLFRSFHLASSFLNSKNRERDIRTFLSKQNLPLKLDECFWGTFTLNSNLNLIAAKKEVVEKYIAQVKESGLAVAGVTASFIALYNALICAYPERAKERFALLNIRDSSSELLIHENGRLWVNPLSIGARDLIDTQGNSHKLENNGLASSSQSHKLENNGLASSSQSHKLENNGLASDSQSHRFAIEVQRIFNAYYLQNSPSAQKVAGYFYLCGQECPAVLTASLKNSLGDFEIIVLEPFKRISTLNKQFPVNQQMLSLSLGLGLTYLEAPLALGVNLIEENIKKERSLFRGNLLRKVSFSSCVFIAFCLLPWDIKLIANLRKQASLYKKTSFEVSTVLPQVKALKEEQSKLQKLQDFLENRLSLQALYLKALAVISESKPSSVTIKELDIQTKDNRLQVFLSGGAPAYQEINDFLNGLKKNKDLKEVKVIASALSGAETQSAAVDFKLRFEIPGADIKAPPDTVSQAEATVSIVTLKKGNVDK